MKISLEKYLLNSSVFIIFSEGFFVNYIIDWKLMYFILLINYIILLKFYTIKFHKYFIYFIVFVLVHAVITYSILKIPPNYFISQILGITVTATYFYNIVKVLPSEKIKNTYLQFALYVAIIGYVFYFIGLNIFAYFPQERRLMSVFKEPAHYVVVILPACYFFLKNKQYLKFAILFVSILLSKSSLGYVGIGFIFILPYLRLKRILYFIISIPFIVSAFLYTYNNVEQFQMRVDHSLENLTVLKNGKFDYRTNLSSYVLLSNLYIAKNNFLEHPLGSGIGSHHYMHTQKYSKLMRPPWYIVYLKHDKDNSFDANSLFTRLFSEFGVFGLILIIYIVFLIFKSFKTKNFFVQGVAIYFALKLLRDGTYFPPELFFFFWLFIFDSKRLVNE